jgi:hypothetical protein
MRKHKIQKAINEYLQNNCIKNAQDLIDIEEILNNDEIELPNNIVINRNGICIEEFINWYTLLRYPKTYTDCCEIVNASPYVKLVYDISDGQKYSYDIDNLNIYENIRRLKICRDAYWKIAGDWKPNWTKENERKYCIVNTEGNIIKWVQKTTNKILAFPTAEMRDAFYENFKDLIEICKELL